MGVLDPFNVLNGWDTSTTAGQIGNFITAGPRHSNAMAVAALPYMIPYLKIALGPEYKMFESAVDMGE
jgi:hypothetical protein